mgnify:CR=1 FL=1
MKDKRILLAVLLTSVFLIITGITYAYFSLVVSGNDVAETINVSTTKIELIYTDGNEIKVDSIEPKWTTTKTITVENTGNEEAYYALGWQKLYNEIQKDELVIRSTCTSSGATGGTCDNTDDVVIPETAEVTAEANKVIYPYKENVKILPGEKHTYTVTIEFINYEDKAQNYNQGKRFYGTLGAAESTKKLPTLANYLIDNYSTLGLTKIEHEATGNQNYATTEYRYQGATPNNYITFNEEVGKWRIIGVFEVETAQIDGTYKKETKVKIIRNSIGANYWNNTAPSTGANYSDWRISSLNVLLNEKAYNGVWSSLKYTIKDSARPYISSTKWYLGNVGSTLNTSGVYEQERSTTVHEGNTDIWNGYIALMYPSDYMYSSKECYNDDAKTGATYNNSVCTASSWLVPKKPTSEGTYNNYLLLSPTPSDKTKKNCVVCQYWNCGLMQSSNYVWYDEQATLPVLYLNPQTEWASGDGGSSTPFIISGN